MPPGSNHRPTPSADSGLGADPEDHRDHSPERGRAPNERTRLLSPEPYEGHPPQWLSPDDPAVTPYNLWSVRILRLMTMVIAGISAVWFCVLLVSMFATPPGMHTPGSVFYALFYTIVTMVTLTSLLLFFDAPAQSSRILSLIISLVLVLDTVLVLAVEKTRIEEGWVGVASVLWALLVSLWVILVDVTVRWGKAEEEERLTGRAETRRSATEWVQVILSNVTLTCVLVAYAMASMNLILRSFDAALAPPGQQVWVDGGKYRMHVYCADVSTPDPSDSTPYDRLGKSYNPFNKSRKPNKPQEPTLLLLGGEVAVEDGLWQVAQHAIHNGSIERYCMVDRPGYAWSDAAPSPLSASMSVAAITEALSLAGEHGPWVVAGAGTGSFYARIFAQQQGPEAVAGLLLIDPVHEQMLPHLGGAARGFGLFLNGLVSPLGLVRIPGAVLRGRSRADRVWGRAARQGAKTAFARLQENLVAGSLTQREVLATRTLLRDWDVPLGLVSSGVETKKDPQWDTFQRDLASLTRNLAGWETVNDAPHKIWKTEKGRWAVEGMMRKLING